MSLNEAERRQTAVELSALRAQLPVSDDALADRLGYPVADLQSVLCMNPGVNPREVWRVRDFLVSVAQECHVEVPEFSVMKDSGHGAARMWFGSWDVPNAKGLG